MTDTIVIKSEEVKEPEGHTQAMIDKVDQASQVPSEVAPEERPQWLPEKFKSPEDLAKAYAELESKLGQKPAEQPKAEVTIPTDATPADAEKQLADKGLDLTEFSQEFARNGELSEESYEKLTKAGFDKNLVDQFIEGQKARAVQFESAIKTEVGGDERYSQMVEWAKANLTPAEIDAYNSAVSSGNTDQAKLAALGLAMKFEKAVGSEPKRMIGGNAAPDAGDVFESRAQLTAAMKDPRYKSDPAYRAKVQQKIARSNVI